MQWFDESLIDTDAKAFGVYVALLHCRFMGYHTRKVLKDIVQREISKLLSNGDRDEAKEAAIDFLDIWYTFSNLHIHEKDLILELNSIEKKIL